MLSNELMRLDLPTLERPRKEISGSSSCGQSASLNALLRNSALVIFIFQRAPPSACNQLIGSGLSRSRRARLLLARCRELFETLTHAGHARLDVRHAFDDRFQALGKFRVIEHRAEVLQDWLDLHVNEHVFTVRLIEQLFI